MIYQHELAVLKQKDWQLSERTVQEWREAGFIPDTYALHSNPYTKVRQRWYMRLLALAGDGWLNGEAICRHYGWPKTRLSNILSFQRDPESKAIRTLYGEEIDALRTELLQPLSGELTKILSGIYRTPTDTPVSEAVQRRLVRLLSHPMLNEGRVRHELLPSDSEKLRNVVRGKRSLLTRLSDKPLLLRIADSLQQMKVLLSLEPEGAEETPKTAPVH